MKKIALLAALVAAPLLFAQQKDLTKSKKEMRQIEMQKENQKTSLKQADQKKADAAKSTKAEAQNLAPAKKVDQKDIQIKGANEIKNNAAPAAKTKTNAVKTRDKSKKAANKSLKTDEEM